MEIKVAVSVLIAGALGVVGCVGYGLIMFGVLEERFMGLGMGPLVAGSVLYVRSLIYRLVREDRVARELRELLRQEVVPIRQGR